MWIQPASTAAQAGHENSGSILPLQYAKYTGVTSREIHDIFP